MTYAEADPRCGREGEWDGDVDDENGFADVKNASGHGAIEADALCPRDAACEESEHQAEEDHDPVVADVQDSRCGEAAEDRWGEPPARDRPSNRSCAAAWQETPASRKPCPSEPQSADAHANGE